MRSRRAIGATLFLCLAASQAAILVLTPVLPALASDLGVSTATAGQLRTISGLSAGVTALLVGLLASRVGLRGLLGSGLVLLAVGSGASAVAPSFAAIAIAQLAIGVGIGLSYTAALAAVADWTTPADRSRVLAVALLGPPTAWIVGMPLSGLVGEASWRIAWIAAPFAFSLVALVVLARMKSAPPASTRADIRAVLAHPGVMRWSSGELLAYSAWAGTLVFVGALFVESYGLSSGETGLVLGSGALVLIPGNLLFRRWVDHHGRALLVVLALGAAVTVAVLGAFRPSTWFSLGAFSVLAFLAGGRTLAGAAAGLDLAPELLLGVTGIRTAALQLGYFLGAAVGGLALAAGGYRALGLALSAMFVAGTTPHLLPEPARNPRPQLP
ncbi:MAG: MFS transporter [Actinobacteria bacterium]|nr:MFS transporter [Actinomycetota bacterium]MBA3565740.1 MFS transporter [Actinomycetota bacterium]MDQ3424739.1 MFS transporter [Actinomycetota bacterium]